jgi:putative DNA methylase
MEPLAPEETARGFKGWYASKQLPHFDAPGTRQFITYRLADALPAARRSEWAAFLALEDDLEKQRRIEHFLDQGYGECYLPDPRIAGLVQENLWHHDGVKYRLLAWVIMPNHVHVSVEIWNVPLGEVLKSWKGYTSKVANKIVNRSGPFWEEDYFDRYVRDDGHYRRVVRYIENNPVKAGMAKAPEDWLWSSARYRGEPGAVVPVLTHPTAKRMPLASLRNGWNFVWVGTSCPHPEYRACLNPPCKGRKRRSSDSRLPFGA